MSEKGSVEEKIKAQVKTFEELCNNILPPNLMECWKRESCEECRQEKWVQLDDVLVVVGEAEAERTKKMQDFVTFLDSLDTRDQRVTSVVRSIREKFEELLR